MTEGLTRGRDLVGVSRFGEIAVPRQPLHEATIASRFQAQAAKTPDNIAVSKDGRSVTYAALHESAARIAGLLDGNGESGRPVGILMDEGPLLIASMFAVLAAGRAFIPLEARLPEMRIAAVLSASGASHVLTDRGSFDTASRIAPAGIKVVDAETWDTAVRRAGYVPVPPDAVASIIYTSGSTGRPKGVAITHAQLLYGVINRTRLFGLHAADRYAHVRSSGSSATANTLLLPLLNGATSCILDLHHQGLQNLGPWIVAEKITGIAFTCSLLRTWLASLPKDFLLPSLRVIAAGSESMYGSDVAMAARHLVGDWRIVHHLSTTETGLVTGSVIGPHDIPEPGILHVGMPVDGTEISLVPAPDTKMPGVGEIVVRSRYIALGYWNEPELTGKAFSTDPLDNTMRSYRTGDLGRWLPNGSLEYLGRKSRKIKLSGYSVEPYEIEDALLRMQGVRDALVVAHGPEKDPSLVAYVATGDEAPPAQEAIRAHLKTILPHYMIPRHVVTMPAFPLTVRGKVDINALPPPEAGPDSSASYRPPDTEQERLLASIWTEVLQRQQIGIDEDFYHLGGTSLQAFTIFARIASELGHDLPPTSMLTAPTIAKQAALLNQVRGAGRYDEIVPFRSEGKLLPLFIVHGAYGDIMFAREVARHIGADRPVYGVQPQSLEGKHELPRSVEKIAASYLTSILQIQPAGPYHLAGYSFGGAVALEMAQQLRQRGEKVALLGLIDTALDGRYQIANETAAARAVRHARQISGAASLSYIGVRLRKMLAYYFGNARTAIGQIPNELRSLLGLSVPYEARAGRYRYLFVQANRRYQPEPFDGAVVVFASKGRAEWQRRRWSSLALGGLRVHEISADHLAMVWPPHSAQLGSLIDECLGAAEN